MPREVVVDKTGSVTRLRARRVAEGSMMERLAAKAKAAGDWKIGWEHGGTVANSYGYPAQAEFCVVAGSPDGDAVCWLGRTGASKGAAICGAAESVIPGCSDYFTKARRSDEKRAKARQAIVDAARRELLKATPAGEVAFRLGGVEALDKLE